MSCPPPGPLLLGVRVNGYEDLMTSGLDTKHSLVDLFNEYFEVVRADSPEKRRECYRLRYQVYCKEGVIPGFNPDDYPEGLEYDYYDEHSVHSLLVHKATGQVAGSVRIIPTNRKNPKEKLPLEIITGDSIFHDPISCKNIPRSCIAEISRLILAPKFRTRKWESQNPYGIAKDYSNFSQENERDQSNIESSNFSCQFENVPRRVFPHAILGLFVAIVRMSKEQHITHWCSAMEPAFARFLRSFGINFIPISPILEYHGPRRGYFGSAPQIMENLYKTQPKVWALLTDNGVNFSPPSGN